MRRTFKNAPIAVKISIPIAICMACIAIRCWISIRANSTLSRSAQVITIERLPKIQEYEGIERGLLVVYSKFNQSLAWQSQGYPADTISQLDGEIRKEVDRLAA